jgi:hypothetical protein
MAIKNRVLENKTNRQFSPVVRFERGIKKIELSKERN